MENRRVIIASNNSGKINEMKDILSNIDAKVLSLEEIGLKEDIVEDGQTFFDNAFKKASFVNQIIKDWTVGDDSGLCIKILNGEPGVFSARWAGEKRDGGALIEHALEKMKGIPSEKREAWFESCVVLFSPQGKCQAFSGKLHGKITESPRGEMRPRLPYDSIFVPDGSDQTLAEMSLNKKNSLSHRGKALSALKKFLKNNFYNDE